MLFVIIDWYTALTPALRQTCIFSYIYALMIHYVLLLWAYLAFIWDAISSLFQRLFLTLSFSLFFPSFSSSSSSSVAREDIFGMEDAS